VQPSHVVYYVHFIVTGAVVPGRPEARFEAYARGFAGCGPYTSAAYRRSYGRLYELICCGSHAADDKYIKLWKTRPQDIIGRFVRLEPLEVSRHLKDLWTVTSGEPALENKGYDPEEIWGFLEEGPFENGIDMRKSFVFQRKMSEASFAIVHGVTERVMGAIILRNDDPKNLTIQMEPPIIQPFREGGKEQLEACYLLMDRLYAYGYRRIQISIDSQDIEKRKLATRLGFTLEGVLYKHMVVKECNRDSSVYGLLNNDWKKGARGSLFRKLYGVAAQRSDSANEKREEEFDEQQRFLKEQRRKEAEAAATTKSKDL
jgi:RimJ/RimL family protein N-acetyltransferase